jgi:ribA/ribD-fused uncharacterized protein
MSPHPIKADGVVWRTAEALFQALRFDNDEIREQIRQAKSPMSAKMVATRNRSQMVVTPRSAQDVANMNAVLRLKTEQHPDLLADLVRTGRRMIVEDCTSRKRGNALFWGAAWNGREWVGENRLGQLWMELRDEIRPVRSSNGGR